MNLRFVAFLLVVLATTFGQAQLVASKDMTGREPQPAREMNVPLPAECPQTDERFIDHADGFVRKQHPEKLELSIVSVEPALLAPGKDFKVTVRLKNVGSYNALIPWQEMQVQPAQIDPEDSTVSYQSALISLKVGTAKESPIRIKGELWLHGAPNERRDFLELLPGNWVELSFSGKAECQYDGDLCRKLEPDGRGALTAHWEQWLFEEKVENCRAKTAALVMRRLKSDPIVIGYGGPIHPAK